jgi:hypothetical protein
VRFSAERDSIARVTPQRAAATAATKLRSDPRFVPDCRPEAGGKGYPGRMQDQAIEMVKLSPLPQWRASKLIGLNVYNEQNEKLGGINEVLLDKSGKATGVVIGVGGFLGMGEHDVPPAATTGTATNAPAAARNFSPGPHGYGVTVVAVVAGRCSGTVLSQRREI